MTTCYRLQKAILALKHDERDQPSLQPLEPGACVQPAQPPRPSGLIDIMDTDGVLYTVFYADLVERSESVSERDA